MDDSETVLSFTQSALEEGGYAVITVSSSALLPTVWSRERPDLALIDVSMPVMQGQSVVELIRRNQLHRCPVVLYSARGDEELRALAASCGASGYLRKTQDASRLLSFVSSQLQPAPVAPTRSPQASVRSDELLVFVVDEDEAVRREMVTAVEASGCKAVPIASGAACLDALRSSHPSLVLMSLGMTSMRGDACCMRIRENPDFADIPIVMFSQGSTAEVMQAWRAGADDFLPKPLSGVQLSSKIARLRLQGQGKHPQSKVAPRPVLFVGQSPFFRSRLGRMLEASGYVMIYAKTADEAFAALKSHGKHLCAALFDLKLPGAETLDLLKSFQLHNRGPIFTFGDPDTSDDLSHAVTRITGIAPLDKTLPCETVVGRLNSALSRSPENLRVSTRVPFFSIVDFRHPTSGVWSSGFSFDLSANGVFVTTLSPAAPGDELEMRVAFPGRSPLDCVGRVAWANELQSRRTYSYMLGMGVQFTKMGSAFTETLKLYMPGAVTPHTAR